MNLVTTRVPLRDEAGDISGFVGFISDITELKDAEKLLKVEQERLQTILDAVSIPVIITRISDGGFLYFNEPGLEMVGLTRDNLTGRPAFEFYDDMADREKFLTKLREHGEVQNYELRLKRINGERYWALLSGHIIEYEGEQAIFITVIDINVQREAQASVARRAAELETVAEVGTVAATILDPETLLQQAVDLTKERFALYHAHLYLLGENQKYLILANGAGEIGSQMVAEGRRIALTQAQSLVARAARSKESVVINDVQADPGFLPHPLLPDTMAEMAVPLVVGEEVLGVLDVQADQVDYFTPEEVAVFATLAAQIAVALQNARRHNEAQRALDELNRLQRIMVREGWEGYLATPERSLLGYVFNAKGAQPLQSKEENGAKVPTKAEAGTKQNGKAVETAVPDPESALNIPIAVRGEMIGKIGLRTPDGSVIPERKQALIKTVANQVSEALERARLTEQTQQALQEINEQARRLALLNQLSETISRMTTIEEIAASVMKSVPEILNAKRLSLHLIAEEDPSMLRVVGVAGEVTNVSQNDLIPLADSSMAQAIEKRQIVAGLAANGDKSLKGYHVPLYAGGQPLGTFDIVIPAHAELDEGDRQILLQMASLLSTTLENRRLFNRTKARADRERLLNNITQKIQSTVTMESALQTAVSELGQALKLKKAIIELSTAQNGQGHTQE